MNRRWKEEEKLALVLSMLKGTEPIAALCARHGISATQAYKWRDEFVAAGKAGLRDKRKRANRDPVVDENRQLKQLLGEQALVIDAQKKLAGLLPSGNGGNW